MKKFTIAMLIVGSVLALIHFAIIPMVQESRAKTVLTNEIKEYLTKTEPVIVEATFDWVEKNGGFTNSEREKERLLNRYFGVQQKEKNHAWSVFAEYEQRNRLVELHHDLHEEQAYYATGLAAKKEGTTRDFIEWHVTRKYMPEDFSKRFKLLSLQSMLVDLQEESMRKNSKEVRKKFVQLKEELEELMQELSINEWNNLSM